MISKRRTADDSDDLSLFLGVPPSKDEPEVDELGRAVPSEAGPSSGVRRARREERLTRRKRRAPKTPEDEGLSTDDELAQGDQEDYAAAQRSLEKRVKELSEDVRAEDFRDPEKGLAVRFGDWRAKYPDDYANAFGGLSMVQAWAFWTRGEMVGWEPLRVGSASIDRLCALTTGIETFRIFLVVQCSLHLLASSTTECLRTIHGPR